MAWLASGLGAVGSGLGAAGSAIGTGAATVGQYALPALQGLNELSQIGGGTPGAPPPLPMGGAPLTQIGGAGQQHQQQQPEWYVDPHTNRLSRRFLPQVV